jgi:multiple sugar transport system substrate-binding protein
LNKSIMLLVSLVFVLGLILAGCGGNEKNNSQNNGANSGGQSPEAKGEVVLQFWSASDSFNADGPGGKIIANFNEKYKGKINIVSRYMPWDQYNTAIQAAFASNTLPDIYQVPSNLDLGQAVEKKMARSINDLVSQEWKNLFMDGSFAEGINMYDGEIYSYPMRGPQMNSILYYNIDLLKDAGYNEPPKTWDEFREMSIKVTELGKGDVFGLVAGLTTPKVSRFIVSGLSDIATGTNPEDDWGFNYQTGQYNYDDPEMIKAVQFLNQLKDDGVILPASYTFKEAEAAAMFGNGKSAFFISGRYQLWTLKRDYPELNLGLSVVPKETESQPFQHYTLATSSRVIVVSNQTEHVEEVGLALTEAIASEEYFVDSIRSGVSLAPMDSLNKDESLYPYPEFKTFYELHDKYLKVRPDPVVRNVGAAKAIVAMGGMGQPRIEPDFAGILQMILTGRTKDIAEALTEYNERMNAGLKQAIEEANSEGANTTLDDFTFPNWDPNNDFTNQDY